MSVIPLTLTLSLCLVFIFVIMFFREQTRRRFSSTESESLLPFADETSQVTAPVAQRPSPEPCRGSSATCGKQDTAASSVSPS